MSETERDTERDLWNVQLAGAGESSQETVDRLNKEFYGRFNFPWPPLSFEAFEEQQWSVRMLHQNLGCFSHDRLPERPRIWVAGCGTNQAVYTALRFPDSEVLGTDISTESLATCRDSARQVGAENLRLWSSRPSPFRDGRISDGRLICRDPSNSRASWRMTHPSELSVSAGRMTKPSARAGLGDQKRSSRSSRMALLAAAP